MEVREVPSKMRLDEEGKVMDEAVTSRREIILRSYHCRLCYVSTFFSSYSIITVLFFYYISLKFLETFVYLSRTSPFSPFWSVAAVKFFNL